VTLWVNLTVKGDKGRVGPVALADGRVERKRRRSLGRSARENATKELGKRQGHHRAGFSKSKISKIKVKKPRATKRTGRQKEKKKKKG